MVVLIQETKEAIEVIYLKMETIQQKVKMKLCQVDPACWATDSHQHMQTNFSENMNSFSVQSSNLKKD